MKRSKAQPSWFVKLASELARRNTGKIDVSVAQMSEALGHLADHAASLNEDTRLPWFAGKAFDLFERLYCLGRKRLAAAAKRKS